MDQSTEALKARLRERARQKRASLHPGQRAEAARQAARHFFAGIALDADEIVAAYWPIRDELDCQAILLRLMEDGHRVCLPVVLGEAQPLEMRLWVEGEALYPAGYGALAPNETAPVVEPDLILVPLLGFDAAGTRLGYGGGYYDRTLAKMSKRPQLVGVAFSVQELDHVPSEAHDVPLDAVLTETGLRRFGGDA